MFHDLLVVVHMIMNMLQMTLIKFTNCYYAPTYYDYNMHLLRMCVIPAYQ